MKNIEDVWLSQLSETIASESVSDLNRTDCTLYEKCNKAEAASDERVVLSFRTQFDGDNSLSIQNLNRIVNVDTN
jgi:hypothetical protein